MSLLIQQSMHTYKGTADYSQKKGCLPVMTWVSTGAGFDLFFRHIFSNQRLHTGKTQWTFYPHDNEFTPGHYEITQENAEFLRSFYKFQMENILKLSYDSMCTVCCQEMKKDEQIFIFQCKHTVHVECCRKNQKELHYYVCPNCRGKVERIDTITLEQQEEICIKLVEFFKSLKKPFRTNTHPRYLHYSFKIRQEPRVVKTQVKLEVNSQLKPMNRVVEKKPEPNPELNPTLKPLTKTQTNDDEGWIIVRSKIRQPKCRYGSQCWFGQNCRYRH